MKLTWPTSFEAPRPARILTEAARCARPLAQVLALLVGVALPLLAAIAEARSLTGLDTFLVAAERTLSQMLVVLAVPVVAVAAIPTALLGLASDQPRRRSPAARRAQLAQAFLALLPPLLTLAALLAAAWMKSLLPALPWIAILALAGTALRLPLPGAPERAVVGSVALALFAVHGPGASSWVAGLAAQVLASGGILLGLGRTQGLLAQRRTLALATLAASLAGTALWVLGGGLGRVVLALTGLGEPAWPGLLGALLGAFWAAALVILVGSGGLARGLAALCLLGAATLPGGTPAAAAAAAVLAVRALPRPEKPAA